MAKLYATKSPDVSQRERTNMERSRKIASQGMVLLQNKGALPFKGVKVGGFVSTWNGSSVAVLHNTTQRTITVDLAEVTDLPFAGISAAVGFGGATLEGTVLTLEGQTSVVLR